MCSHRSFAILGAPVAARKSSRCASNVWLDTTCFRDLATKVAVLISAMLYTTMLTKCSNTVCNVTILAKHVQDQWPISAKLAALITYAALLTIGSPTSDNVFALLEWLTQTVYASKGVTWTWLAIEIRCATLNVLIIRFHSSTMTTQ